MFKNVVYSSQGNHLGKSNLWDWLTDGDRRDDSVLWTPQIRNIMKRGWKILLQTLKADSSLQNKRRERERERKYTHMFARPQSFVFYLWSDLKQLICTADIAIEGMYHSKNQLFCVAPRTEIQKTGFGGKCWTWNWVANILANICMEFVLGRGIHPQNL